MASIGDRETDRAPAPFSRELSCVRVFKDKYGRALPAQRRGFWRGCSARKLGLPVRCDVDAGVRQPELRTCRLFALNRYRNISLMLFLR